MIPRRVLPAVILLAALAGNSDAQRSAPVHPELRAEATAGHVSSYVMGGGIHARAGTYFRLALLGGYGIAAQGDATSQAMRFETQGRFHLDPYREAGWGLYGLGGVAATHDDFRRWQARLVLGAGVELPARGQTVLAFEGAFAGGVRLTAVVRRFPPRGR